MGLERNSFTPARSPLSRPFQLSKQCDQAMPWETDGECKGRVWSQDEAMNGSLSLSLSLSFSSLLTTAFRC